MSEREAKQFVGAVVGAVFLMVLFGTFFYPDLPFAPQIRETLWRGVDPIVNAFCWTFPALLIGTIGYIIYRLFVPDIYPGSPYWLEALIVSIVSVGVVILLVDLAV